MTEFFVFSRCTDLRFSDPQLQTTWEDYPEDSFSCGNEFDLELFPRGCSPPFRMKVLRADLSRILKKKLLKTGTQHAVTIN
jgi:hypothetical protein